MRKYRGKLQMKRFLAILFVGLMVVSVAACGSREEEFDAKGYIQSVLDAKYQQNYTAYAEGLEISDEEAKEQLTSEFNASAEEYIMSLGMTVAPEELAEYLEMEVAIRQKVVYEVQDAVKNEDGTYDVEVLLTPIDAYAVLKDSLASNLQAAVNGGAIEEQYMGVYLESLQYSVDNAPAAESVTFTLHVLFEENEDEQKIYYIDEQELIDFDLTATCQMKVE